MRKERFKLVAEVHLFLVRGEEILMIRRFNTGFADGQYSVPAGHMDGGEEVTLATIREAREEVGVELSPDDLRFAGVMHRRCAKENIPERVSFFMAAERWSGSPRNCEPNKCDDVVWRRFDDLPDNTIPYVRRAIENLRRGVFYGAVGWED